MAVDLHRIGTGISSGRSRNGFGNIVSFPSVSGFPAYGTVLSTASGVTYEQAIYEAYSAFLVNNVYTYNCDVNTVADGAGGSFIDWANAVNVYPKNNGTFIASSTDDFPDNPVAVAGNYYNSGAYPDTNEVHSGTGNIITVGAGTFVYHPNGQNITSAGSQDNTTEVPDGSGYFYSDGTYTNYMYVWDGWGSFYQDGGSGAGSYHSAGTEVDTGLRYNEVNLETEVPSMSGHWENNGKVDFDSYYWNGTGTANSNNYNPNGSFYSNGTFIYNDGMNDYYWDGNGGYYI